MYCKIILRLAPDIRITTPKKKQNTAIHNVAKSIGHGKHVPPLLQITGHGGTVSKSLEEQQTRN